MIEKFQAALKSQKIIKRKDRIGIACSGGPDSTALVRLIAALPDMKFKVYVLHYNHGLRKSAVKDASFVKKLSLQTDSSAVIEKRSKGLTRKKKESLEEAARKWRYDFLVRAAKNKKLDAVLLAHTQDDQAETVLMRMLQGTGGRGLCGIRETLKINGVLFYRPLLAFSKQDILQWMRDQRYSFRVDPSNRSSKMLRNKIRLELMPYLRKHYNARVSEALSRIPTIMVREEEALTTLAEQAWVRVLIRKSRDAVCLDQKRLTHLPSALQFRLLDKALKILHPSSGLLAEHWTVLQESLARRRYGVDLPRKIRLTIEKDKLALQRSRIH